MKKFIHIVGLGAALLIMASCSATAPQSGNTSGLAGTSWEVTGYNDGSQGMTDVLPGTSLTANFGEDGTMTGNSGCNDYNGPYKITGNQIGIGPLGTTRKACGDPAGAMEQEAQYLAALDAAQVYVIDGNNLELRLVDGTVAAKFARK
jgi:heat shock protein HslJ